MPDWKNLSRTSSLIYLMWLWPMLLVFAVALLAMRLTGNTEAIGLPAWVSWLDIVLFLCVYVFASIWVQRPLAHWGKRKRSGSSHYQRAAELVMSALPWRAATVFAIAGCIYSTYLVLMMVIVSAMNDHFLSWRMILALVMTFYFGLAVAGPALGGAQSIAYAASVRRHLAKKGVFLSNLRTGKPMHAITRAAGRPWVLYLVTGLLPTSLLAVFVILALGIEDQTEKNFILSQAAVLFVISLIAGSYIVFTTSRTLRMVAHELLHGLNKLHDGDFHGRVPVMIDDEFGMLARGLNTALQGLQEREDLKDSLKIATEIQDGLLPKTVPNMSDYSLLGFQQSCYAIGGDYYDYIQSPDNRLWMMVADVSGKGYPAALTVANLQAMLHGIAYLNTSIEDAAVYINDRLCETLTGGRFVTIFIATLEVETHSLSWLNAGQLPPLFSNGGVTKSLHASSPPMGLTPNLTFDVQHEKMNPDDIIFVYTDGLTDTLDRSGKEIFGEKRLFSWFAEHEKEPLDQMKDNLLLTLADFGKVAREDDMTILCLRREA
ncbi:MAG: SpoIIE family protein phosphatase [Mariprofundaceae bacterium]